MSFFAPPCRRLFTTVRCAVVIGAATSTVLIGGCVRRTLHIESEPAGAVVWLNDREIGRTPVDVDFAHYGTYDLRMSLEGYEPLWVDAVAAAPWWDTVGVDLAAELLPANLHSEVFWSYQLQPVVIEQEPLMDRARDLRTRLADEQAAESPGADDFSPEP
jgi:hypothetical protein